MRILQCEFPGCSASVTLTGLPTNGDAQCFLTLKVRITDFSGPEEVVEYIRSGNGMVWGCSYCCEPPPQQQQQLGMIAMGYCLDQKWDGFVKDGRMKKYG